MNEFSKLSKQFLAKNVGGGYSNELVVLPVEGDVGFDEYFDYKSEIVMKAKRIFLPSEQNKLLLSYPGPNTSEKDIFDKFFESPSIVSHNHTFEGCFGIDITDYIGKMDDEHFQRLISYVSNNPSAVYVFVLFTDNNNEVLTVEKYLGRYFELSTRRIKFPSKKKLEDYTYKKIEYYLSSVDEKKFEDIKKDLSDILSDYYANRKKCGYEEADVFVRYLKNELTDKNIKSINFKKAIEKVVQNINGRPGSTSAFGY